MFIHFHRTYIFAAISWHFDAEPEKKIFCVKNKYVKINVLIIHALYYFQMYIPGMVKN